MPSNTKTISKSVQESYFNTTDDALVCYLEFDQATGTVVDLSNTGNDATITGTYTVSDERVGTASRKIAATALMQIASPTTTLAEITHDNSMSVSVWIKSLSDAQVNRIVVSQVNGAGTGQGWIVVNDNTDGNREFSTLLGGTKLYSGVNCNQDQWYHVVANCLTPQGPIINGDLEIWVDGILANQVDQAIDQSADGAINISADKVGGSDFYGWMHQLTIWNRGLLPEQIAALYNKGVIQFQGAPGLGESSTVSSGYIDGTPLEVQTGSFRLITDTIDGNKTKVIECVTAGLISAPVGELNMTETEAAYGTWEWWMYKGSDATAPNVLFTAEANATLVDANQNGYAISFNIGEAIVVREVSAGSTTNIMATIVNYLDIATWYGIKITRDSSGSITVYIRDIAGAGGFSSDYAAISVNAGTNPATDTTHTSGKFMVFDMDVGDKFVWGAVNDKYSITKNLIVK